MTAPVSASGAVALTLDLSDEVIERLAARVVERVAALVPTWLPERPLNQQEMAVWLGVDVQTLRRWARDGDFVPFQHGRTTLYTPAMIAEFLAHGALRSAE